MNRLVSDTLCLGHMIARLFRKILQRGDGMEDRIAATATGSVFPRRPAFPDTAVPLQTECKRLKTLVGARGIEPLTPTMST